jgi:hypothetical protein
MVYHKLQLPCPCKRIVKRCLRIVAVGRSKALCLINCLNAQCIYKHAGAKNRTGASRSPRQRQDEHVFEMLEARPKNNLAEGCGPRGALRKVVEGLESEFDKQAFVQKAALDAILGACPKSMNSVRCGIRCYVAYAQAMQPEGYRYFPPKLDILLSWSTLFRSEGTWANYIGYVRTACILIKAPVDVFSDPAMRRAKIAIRKRCLFTSRKTMFLQVDLVRKILRWALKPENLNYRAHAFLYLISYIFLLRLPSEALPLKGGRVDGQACIYVEGKELVLELPTRPGICDLCIGFSLLAK